MPAMLFILMLAFNSWAGEPDPVLIESVAKSDRWHRLMHYEKNWYGGVRSTLDGQGFFFAGDGKWNPEAELRASIKAMGEDRKVGKLQLHPQCSFPERFRFLRETFNLGIPAVECPKFREFMGMFNDPQALSVIFSSAFPNNPASMFGHTFIKIRSARSSDLLDNGINFAAYVAPDDNSIAFIWRGTMGGYFGAWSTEPYYVKVNEYSNFESRDLWEYELNLTPEEVRRVIAHFWELEVNSHFDYYFFDENCSYQILAAITAIRPEWEAILYHRIYVIPGETVKNLTETEGVVRQVKFRPSAHNKLYQRYGVMTSAEREEFFGLARGERPLEGMKSRFVLDAVAAYFDYLRNEAKGDYKKHYEARREELLSYRAKLGVSTQEEIDRLPPIEAGTRPEMGHDPYALSLGLGWRAREHADGEVINLKIKSAYHDLLNNDKGFTRYSHIDFPWVEFQYDGLSEQLRIEQLGALAITSLPPWTKLDRRHSWKLQLGMVTARDYGCETCRHVRGEVGAGLAVAMGQKSVAYVLPQARLDLYHRLQRGYRIGPGVEAGFLSAVGENYRLRLAATEQWHIFQDQHTDRFSQVRFDHAYSLSRNLELRQANVIEMPHDRAHLNWWESRLDLTIFFR